MAEYTVLSPSAPQPDTPSPPSYDDVKVTDQAGTGGITTEPGSDIRTARPVWQRMLWANHRFLFILLSPLLLSPIALVTNNSVSNSETLLELQRHIL